MPEVGRFISEDPWAGTMLQPNSLNTYPYVLNNPLRYVDPLGLSPQDGGWMGGSIPDKRSTVRAAGLKEEWEYIKGANSSWKTAGDFWTMGGVSNIERVFNSEPFSLENLIVFLRFFRQYYLKEHR